MKLPNGKYMVGILGSAKILDLKSLKAAHTNLHGVTSGYGVPLGFDIIREIAYTKNTEKGGLITFKVALSNPDGGFHCKSLHRFIAIVAGAYKLTIFSNLEYMEDKIVNHMNQSKRLSGSVRDVR